MRTLIALLLLVAPSALLAQASTCRIGISGLDFGAYRAVDPSPDTAIGRLDVTCLQTSGAALPRVTLSTGSSGHYTTRTMLSGSSELRYNLFAEPSRRLVLGDGSAGTIAFPAPRTRSSGRATWPIFGAIAPGQSVPAGVYTDILLIQVEF